MNFLTFVKINFVLLFYTAVVKVSKSDVILEEVETPLSEEKFATRKEIFDLLENLLKPVRDEHHEMRSRMSDLNRELLELKSLVIEKTKKLETAISKAQERECIKHGQNEESCIEVPICGFCVNENFTFNKCDIPQSLIDKGCPKSDIIETNRAIVVVNEQNDSHHVVDLCLGMKKNISFTFHSKNIPIDVYLLGDKHVQSRLNNASYIFDRLSPEVQSISSDYKIGCGISQDKPQYPFGVPLSSSFKNILPLTTETGNFSAYLKAKTHTTLKSDDKGSQLVGMFQAAACKTQIGWRNRSRKILLVAATWPYHVQGDGILGNITQPFDNFCSLNEGGYYVGERTQDYPSEDQILQIIKNENINVVFALFDVKNDTQQYRNLADRLNPRALIYDADHEFKTLPNVLPEAYKEMNSVIELEQSQTSEDIRVNLFSNCGSETEERTSRCNNVVNGLSTFRVEVEMVRCPSLEPNKQQLLKLSAKGLPISVEISVNLLCACTSQ